jgi:predicted ATPase
LAFGTALRGWARADQGEQDEAIAQIQQGIDARRVAGTKQLVPYLLALLAEGSKMASGPDQRLTIISEALDVVEQTKERWYEAELHRLRGHLLLSCSASNRSAAEACFNQAIVIAQSQTAKSLELRAVMSLARLWHDQGKRAQAHDLLSPIFAWFTEGFDTADLKEAKALTEELS